ncbi:IclR family transcriptional regulator [Rhizobium giardinii]|uniref:DNA-binding IclR family transcriptional regulator n=1 Tax=Rhizobium giardinii TaxID=56731 RepID=A0A7W8UH72_9HYPH|nr:IclR family transcriptional regulator [Rhizobium giardinii]MBB5539173.1 DNA-binding IclR family transcriptional regulator [Rhizobium giardinii]
MIESKDKRPGSTMKTIDKAMFLLGFFAPETPEYRLSDLARAADMDKVTTMRILASLVASGFVEQHPETRRYRLGTAVLRLARIREASFPVIAVLQPILETLTGEVGESTHACLFSGKGMTTIAIAEPHRSTRVFIDPAQPLPIHATASGLVFLAYADDAIVNEALRRLNVPTTYTDSTVKSETELRQRLEEIRKNGCAISSRSFENDVTGIAAPIFNWHGKIQATISAACISTRMTPELEREIEGVVLRASVTATRAMGGEPPNTFLMKIKENA